MGKEKEKTSKSSKRPVSMSFEPDTKHPWPEVEAIQRDRLNSQDAPPSRHNDTGHAVTKTKSVKKKGGLFSKFRKSTNDLSEWNKNDEKLSEAVDHGQVNRVIGLLTKKAVNPTKVDPKGQTALHNAAEHGHLGMVEVMLSHKADPRAQDVQGRTALCCAVRYGRTQVASRLMQDSSTLGAADLRALTALHHATLGGSADCVRLLVSHGAPLDAQDKEGMTALMYACKSGYASICRELVEAGANVNVPDSTGRAAVTYAAQSGHAQVCDFLVKRGANLKLSDKEGNDAFAWATLGGYKEIQTLFERAPTQAHWNTDPATTNGPDHTYENLKDIASNGDETTEVTPYDSELEHDKLDLSITPFFAQGENDFSAVRVNYEDDSDELASAIVPMHQISTSHTQRDSSESDDAREEKVHSEAVVTQKTASRGDIVSMDAYKELEEEHDVLLAELQRITLENKHLKDRQEREAAMHNHSIPDEDTHDAEEESRQIEELTSEISTLRVKLAESDRKLSVLGNESVLLKRSGSALNDSSHEKGSSLVNDSWMDSGDEDSPRDRVDDVSIKQIAVLKSQVLELSHHNEHLRHQVKVLDEVNKNELNMGERQTLEKECEELKIYKTTIEEDLQNLQHYLAGKCTHPEQREDRPVAIKSIQQDIEIIFRKLEAHSRSDSADNGELVSRLYELQAANKHLQDDYSKLQVEHETLIDQVVQDEQAQGQYRREVQQETARLQTEKAELAQLMHQVQLAMRQKQEAETAQQRDDAQPNKHTLSTAAQDPLAPEKPQSTLASLTMQGITMDLSDLDRAKPDVRSDSTDSESEYVSAKLIREKDMLESVIKQVKDEKDKLCVLDNQLHDSKESFQTLQAQINQANDELDAKRKEIEDADEKMLQCRADLQDLQHTKNEQQTEMELLKEQVNSQSSQLAELDSSLSERSSKHEQLDNLLKSKTDDFEKLQEQITKENERLEITKEKCTLRQKDFEELNAASKILELEMESIKNDNIKLSNEQEELEKQIATCNIELESVLREKKITEQIELISETKIIPVQAAIVTETTDRDIEAFRERIKDREKEIERLQEINQSLTDELETTQNTEDKQNASVEKLKDENERLRDENEYLIANNNSTDNDTEKEETNYQHEVKVLKRENSRLYDDIKMLRSLMETGADTGEPTKGEVTYLRNQNEALASERQQLEVNNMELQDLMETLQQTMQRREQDERAELKRAVFEAMDRQRGAAESDTDSEVLDYRLEVDDLRALNADQLGELEQLRADKLQLQSALGQLQDASEGMIHTHTSGREEFEVQINEVRQEKEVLETEVSSLKLVNTELQEKLDRQIGLTHAQKTSDNSLLDDFRKLQEDYENIQEQLMHTQEENDQFLESIKEMQRQLKYQDKQSDTIRNLNEDNDVLVMEIKDLQKQIQSLNKVKSASNEIEELKTEMSVVKNQNKELDEENKVLLREQVRRHIEEKADKSDNEKEKSDDSDGEEKAVEERVIQESAGVVEVKRELAMHVQHSDEAHMRALTQVNTEVNELKEHNTALVAQIEELHAKLENMGAEHEAELTEEQDRSQVQLDKMMEMSKELSKEIEHYKDLIEDLKDDNDAKVQDLMEEQDFLLEKIKALEMTQKKDKYEDEAPLNEKDEIIQELETQVTDVKQQLHTSKQHIQTLQEENEKYKKEAGTEEELEANEAASARMSELEQQKARMSELEQQKVRMSELEQQKARMSELEQQKVRMSELEQQKARMSELEQQKVRMSELEQQKVRMSELEQQKVRMSELEQQKVRMSELEQQKAQLHAQVAELQTKLASKLRSRSPSAEREQLADQQQLHELQQAALLQQHQLKEMDRRYKDIVNTYRTHLLAAAEGRMDPEVRDALMHIIKLRAPDQVSSC